MMECFKRFIHVHIDTSHFSSRRVKFQWKFSNLVWKIHWFTPSLYSMQCAYTWYTVRNLYFVQTRLNRNKYFTKRTLDFRAFVDFFSRKLLSKSVLDSFLNHGLCMKISVKISNLVWKYDYLCAVWEIFPFIPQPSHNFVQCVHFTVCWTTVWFHRHRSAIIIIIIIILQCRHYLFIRECLDK